MDSSPELTRIKVRRLTLACLLVWSGATLLPVWAARHPDWHIGAWPLHFWMAAQGCVLVYLAVVAYYAWQVNRWERQSGEAAFEIPPGPEA